MWTNFNLCRMDRSLKSTHRQVSDVFVKKLFDYRQIEMMSLKKFKVRFRAPKGELSNLVRFSAFKFFQCVSFADQISMQLRHARNPKLRIFAIFVSSSTAFYNYIPKFCLLCIQCMWKNARMRMGSSPVLLGLSITVKWKYWRSKMEQITNNSYTLDVSQLFLGALLVLFYITTGNSRASIEL